MTDLGAVGYSASIGFNILGLALMSIVPAFILWFISFRMEDFIEPLGHWLLLPICLIGFAVSAWGYAKCIATIWPYNSFGFDPPIYGDQSGTFLWYTLLGASVVASLAFGTFGWLSGYRAFEDVRGEFR